MNNKRGKLYCDIKTIIYLGILFIVIAYYTINNIGRSGYYPNYLLDFKVGFISRALPGQLLLSLSNSPITREVLSRVSLAASLLTSTILYMLMSTYIIQTLKQYQSKMFVICLFYLIIPNLYNLYFGMLYGWLDIYWLTAFFLSVLCLKNKYTIYLLPIVCFLGLAFHYAFAILVLPTVFLIHFYEMHKSGFALKQKVIFTFNVISSSAWTVYFYIFAKSTVKLDKEEFLKYMLSKTAKTEFNNSPYWNMYYDLYLDNHTHDLNAVIGRFKQVIFTNYPSPSIIIHVLATCIPLLIFVLFVWAVLYKKADTPFLKRFYTILLLLPLSILCIFVGATDFGRWLNAYLNAQFFLFIYVLSEKESKASDAFFSGNKLFTGTCVFLIIALLISYKVGVVLF